MFLFCFSRSGLEILSHADADLLAIPSHSTNTCFCGRVPDAAPLQPARTADTKPSAASSHAALVEQASQQRDGSAEGATARQPCTSGQMRKKPRPTLDLNELPDDAPP